MFLITLGHSIVSGTGRFEPGPPYFECRRFSSFARSRLMSSSTFTANLALPHSLQLR